MLIVFRFHVEVYRKRCRASGIEPVARALFRGRDNSSSDRYADVLSFVQLINTLLCSLTQTSLDGVVTREPKMPAFTKAGLFDYIIELIICEDEVSDYCLQFVILMCSPGLLFD